MKKNFHIIMGDALKNLKTIPDQSVDLIVTSPPYFMGKDYDTSLKLEDFVLIHKSIFLDLYRVLKIGGNLCRQVGYHSLNGEIVPLDCIVYNIIKEYNNNLKKDEEQLYLKNRIIWTFGHGLHSKKKFSGRHETILWYSKGKNGYFNLDAVRIPQKYPGKTYYKGEKKGQISGNPLGKNPGDVWEIPNVKANHIEKTEHPCQFPVALVERLVKGLSPIKGTVLDPFMGSGTSGVAALLHDRYFIGIELAEKYYNIASKRCEDTVKGLIKYREDKPIYVPGKNLAVAKKPSFFKY